jgi:hypothetical protein
LVGEIREIETRIDAGFQLEKEEVTPEGKKVGYGDTKVYCLHLNLRHGKKTTEVTKLLAKSHFTNSHRS